MIYCFNSKSGSIDSTSAISSAREAAGFNSKSGSIDSRNRNDFSILDFCGFNSKSGSIDSCYCRI